MRAKSADDDGAEDISCFLPLLMPPHLVNYVLKFAYYVPTRIREQIEDAVAFQIDNERTKGHLASGGFTDPGS
jgi:hypothetical protein